MITLHLKLVALFTKLAGASHRGALKAITTKRASRQKSIRAYREIQMIQERAIQSEMIEIQCLDELEQSLK